MIAITVQPADELAVRSGGMALIDAAPGTIKYLTHAIFRARWAPHRSPFEEDDGMKKLASLAAALFACAVFANASLITTPRLKHQLDPISLSITRPQSAPMSGWILLPPTA